MKIKPANTKQIIRANRPDRRSDVGFAQLHIFRNDFSHSVMPTGGRAMRHPNFTVNITGNDSDKAKKLFNSIGRVSNLSSDAEIVSDAFNKLASYLFYYGRADFEVIDDGYGLILSFFSVDDVFRIGNIHIQRVAPKLSHKSFKFSFLKNVWRITFPPTICTSFAFRLLIKFMRFADPLFPLFHMKDLEGNKTTRLDSTRFDWLRAVYLSFITKKFGWDRRDSSTEKQSEYFMIYRSVRSQISKAKIREDFTVKFNELFRALSLDALVTVSGIPSVVDLETYLSKLHKGEAPISDSINMTFY